MNRREAISNLSLLLGSTVSAPALSAFLSGCRTPAPEGAYSPAALAVEDFELIATLAEHIIPESDTPGAKAAGVDRYIDDILANVLSEQDRSRFLEGIDAFRTHIRSTSGAAFLELPDERQTALLETIDEETFPTGTENPAASEDADVNAFNFYRSLKQLTIVGYYTSRIGATKELHVMPLGEYRADVPLEEVGRTWA